MFQPAAGDNLEISGSRFQVAPHPSAPRLPYGQEGRQAVVYRLDGEDGSFALKVFKPKYRHPYLMIMTKKMAAYAGLPGMAVCHRETISSDRNLGLLKKHPELMYAAIMPWIEGPTWMEVLLKRKALEPSESLAIVRALLRVLLALEEMGISHGDLSASNILLPLLAEGEEISLVDVEQIYIPGMERPEAIPEGSPGYGFPLACGPMWGPLSDRFAGSVILAEVLAFCDERAIEASSGESFFAESEIGRESPRFDLMASVLEERWGEDVSSIFRRNWFAETLDECAPFLEWLVRIPESIAAEAGIPVENRSAGEPDMTPLSSPEVVHDFEGLLSRAGELESEGNTIGARELYDFMLQSLALTEQERSHVTGRVRLLADKDKERVTEQQENQEVGASEKAEKEGLAVSRNASLPAALDRRRSGGAETLKKCLHCNVDNLDEARFCDNCGKEFEVSRRPPTINVKAPRGVVVSISTGETFELQPDREMLIGRGDLGRGLIPDIMLKDEAALADGVSRLHAKMVCKGNVFYVTDLNSTNSTYLNKSRLDPQELYTLKDGDEIQLGRYLLRLRFT